MNAFPRTVFGWKLRVLWGSLALDSRSIRVEPGGVLPS